MPVLERNQEDVEDDHRAELLKQLGDYRVSRTFQKPETAQYDGLRNQNAYVTSHTAQMKQQRLKKNVTESSKLKNEPTVK